MSVDWIITFVIGFIGVALALAGSTRVVDFMVFVFVFNRGLRRMVDYYVHHEFNPLSPISLAPLLVAAGMLLAALMRMDRLPARIRMVLLGLGAAASYAFVIGFLNVRFAAVYALAEGLAPLGMFGFVLVSQPETHIKDRWIRSFAWAAILASAYGWYQYLTIPPWDKFWLIETKMYGYMGIPLPTQMMVFSTMAERGVLAGFLGLSVVPMIVSKAWRPLPGLLGWAGVVLVFSVILLTLSRGGVLFAAIGTITYLIVNKGRGSKQVAFAIAVLGIAGWFGIERIPNAEWVTKRFESLGEMEEDGSFKGRVEIMSGGVGSVLSQPFGHGLGSAGALASRVNAGSSGPGITPDSGWFIIMLVYGIPGTALLLVALLSAWRLLRRRFLQPALRDGHVLLARSMLISLIPCCFVGDLLTGYSILWLALGCGISVPPRLARLLTTERPVVGAPSLKVQGPEISKPIVPNLVARSQAEEAADPDPVPGHSFSVVPMIVSRKWRPLAGILGWAGVILVFSVILLTLSRGGLLFAVIGAVTYLLINRGRGARQIALAVALLGAAAGFGMEKIPNAERVIKRFKSLGEMEEDGSYQGRVEIISSGFGSLAQQPFGLGLGAVGLATLVNTGTMANDKDTTVADAVITLIPTCFAGELFTGFSIFWLALGCGVVFAAIAAWIRQRRSRRGRSPRRPLCAGCFYAAGASVIVGYEA